MEEHIDALEAVFNSNSEALLKVMQKHFIQTLYNMEEDPKMRTKRIEECYDKMQTFFLHLVEDLRRDYGENKDDSGIAEFLTKKDISSQIWDKYFQIRPLWKILEVPISYQDEFLARKVLEVSASNLAILQKEFELRQDELEMNMEKIINEKKGTLQQVWTRCRYSSDEMSDFPQLYSMDYNKALLIAIINEIKKAEDYYKENREILESAKCYEEALNSLLEFELNECDEKWKNRGGILLKRAAELKSLQKKIIQYRNKIIRLTAAYEQTHGKKFRIDGKPIETYLLKLEQRKDLGGPCLNPAAALAAKSTSSVAATTTKPKKKVLPRFKLNNTTLRTSPQRPRWTGKLEKNVDSDDSDDEWLDYTEFQSQCTVRGRSTEFRGIGASKNE